MRYYETNGCIRDEAARVTPEGKGRIVANYHYKLHSSATLEQILPAFFPLPTFDDLADAAGAHLLSQAAWLTCAKESFPSAPSALSPSSVPPSLPIATRASATSLCAPFRP